MKKLEENIRKQCAKEGIFPMYTEGCLCMELNRLGHHIRMEDKFGGMRKIQRDYAWLHKKR